MINKKSIEAYVRKLFEGEVIDVNISKLGEGVQGAGFLIEVKSKTEARTFVVKGLYPEGLEHDYPADRAGVFLLDLDTFKKLPDHVKALDVLSEMEDGSIKSIGGGREYYLLMEQAEGKHYFNDLAAMAGKDALESYDINRIKSMTSYLAKIHAVKRESRQLYLRKVRDTIGHGECLMGVFDTYPDGAVSYEEMADIEKKCVDWRARLRPMTGRLCQVHGDFHPGNIWFQDDEKFILLDRSRGPWGDAVDDITALTINYIFFSINEYGIVKGAYLEALNMFYEEYIRATGDHDLFKVAAPFYAFRGAVVANPVFYPEVTNESRRKIISFIHGVLDDESFKLEKVNEYVKKGSQGPRIRGFKGKDYF